MSQEDIPFTIQEQFQMAAGGLDWARKELEDPNGVPIGAVAGTTENLNPISLIMNASNFMRFFMPEPDCKLTVFLDPGLINWTFGRTLAMSHVPINVSCSVQAGLMSRAELLNPEHPVPAMDAPAEQALISVWSILHKGNIWARTFTQTYELSADPSLPADVFLFEEPPRITVSPLELVATVTEQPERAVLPTASTLTTAISFWEGYLGQPFHENSPTARL